MKKRDPDSGSQSMWIHLDPNPGQTLPSQKVYFCMKVYLM
jgi:hypothetical protein